MVSNRYIRAPFLRRPNGHAEGSLTCIRCCLDNMDADSGRCDSSLMGGGDARPPRAASDAIVVARDTPAAIGHRRTALCGHGPRPPAKRAVPHRVQSPVRMGNRRRASPLPRSGDRRETAAAEDPHPRLVPQALANDHHRSGIGSKCDAGDDQAGRRCDQPRTFDPHFPRGYSNQARTPCYVQTWGRTSVWTASCSAVAARS